MNSLCLVQLLGLLNVSILQKRTDMYFFMPPGFLLSMAGFDVVFVLTGRMAVDIPNWLIILPLTFCT